ncbi:PDZ domain-containing protein [candidate division KSB1 bacterium]|nr:trypsin-like peptidase domain-containing protein [candidate division KSB1 bacterium]RQW01657.1 MAG: PDZ domain-containing protein [candidate division KSB1 bacterium]
MKSMHRILFGFTIGVVFAVFFLAVCARDTDNSIALEIRESDAADTPDSMDQRRQNEQISMSRQNAITRAVAHISPAVVSINTRKVQQYYRENPWAYDPFFRHFIPRYDRVMREVQGLGSGFLVSKEGQILTNQHVIDGAKEIMVTLPGGEKFEAERIGEDFTSDVAVIKISGDEFPFVHLGNSDDILIGEWAIAIGNPFGLFDVSAQPTVTVGVISAVNQDFGRQDNERIYEDMIQTDAAINSGNSGGPLVNSEGKVIGMNAFIYSGSSSGIATNIGLGFAIPINRVKDVMTDLLKHGAVPRDFWTGIQYQDITSVIAFFLNMNSTDGVIITDVERNSPWDEAGLEIEDVILRIEDIEIRSSKNVDALKERLTLHSGAELELTVYRNRRIYRALVKF